MAEGLIFQSPWGGYWSFGKEHELRVGEQTNSLMAQDFAPKAMEKKAQRSRKASSVQQPEEQSNLHAEMSLAAAVLS